MRGRWWGGLLSAVLLWGTSCTFDRTTASQQRALPVVHAVINPQAPEVVVLLERTLTGHVTIDQEGNFDPIDPIVTGSGDPIRHAHVVIVNELGDTAIAQEDADLRSDGRGKGVYRFLNVEGRCNALAHYCPPVIMPPGYIPPPLNGMRFAVGVGYTLQVRTVEGEIVTSETRIPLAGRPSITFTPVSFNRDHDTLRVAWEPVDGAARYYVHAGTPFGPLILFTDTAHLTISGSLRNFEQDGFPPVLVPGFFQNVGVEAMDQNYFDYVRSNNNPFTGSGIINHVSGGSGLFGAAVPVFEQRYDVTADAEQPIEGTYRAEGTSTLMRLFVESRAADIDRLSGWYSLPAQRVGVLGSLRGSAIRVAVLNGQIASDTAFVLVGTAAGDSLVLAQENALGSPMVWRHVAH